MKYRMLDLLRCTCGQRLRLHPFLEEGETTTVPLDGMGLPRCGQYCGLRDVSAAKDCAEGNAEKMDCRACYARLIREGVLVCECGAIYPVMGGIPRFVDRPLRSVAAFYDKHKDAIAGITGRSVDLGHMSGDGTAEAFASIQESFGAEWSFYDYSRDKTWGWTQQERKRVFLDDLRLETSSLKGALVLDAGCGNGALTASVSCFGMEVVGLDISDSVIAAEEKKATFAKERSGLVHYVQGNLFNPPLERGRFDVIYSSGVLHHTPNTKESFMMLVPLVKKGGRMYVWLYGKRGLLVRLFMWHGRTLRKRVPLRWLFRYCRLISPSYKLLSDMLASLGVYEFRKRSTREIALDLFDCFSPQYNHTHTEREVVKWFAEAGFENIAVSGRQKHGFGVYGDLI